MRPVINIAIFVFLSLSITPTINNGPIYRKNEPIVLIHPTKQELGNITKNSIYNVKKS